MWSFVLASAQVRETVLNRANNPQDAFEQRLLTARAITSMNVPDIGVLTDDSYLAVALSASMYRSS